MDTTKAIKALRERSGIRQADVAKALGMERTNYHRLENRGDKLTIEQLRKIAETLGVTVMDLLTFGDENQSGSAENDVLRLTARLEELEELTSVYRKNAKLLEDAEARRKFYFVLLIDNVMWDIAYRNDIVSSEELKRLGLLSGDDSSNPIKYWLTEFYGETVHKREEHYTERSGSLKQPGWLGSHVWATDYFTTAQQKEIFDVLFSLIWVRYIISHGLTNDFFEKRLELWEKKSTFENDSFTY